MVKWLTIILLAVALPATAMDVYLKWDANTESDLAGYKCYYRGKNVSTFTRYTTVYGFANQTSACNCVIKNLVANGRYNYVVTAFSGSAESGYSNQVNVGATTVKRSIVFKGGGVFK